MQIWLLEKVFLFFCKLAKRWEQLSWLVKKEHLFQKIFFLKVHFFDMYTIHASFNANKYVFQKYVVRCSSYLQTVYFKFLSNRVFFIQSTNMRLRNKCFENKYFTFCKKKFKRVICFKYRPLSMQISTFSQICREVLFDFLSAYLKVGRSLGCTSAKITALVRYSTWGRTPRGSIWWISVNAPAVISTFLAPILRPCFVNITCWSWFLIG